MGDAIRVDIETVVVEPKVCIVVAAGLGSRIFKVQVDFVVIIELIGSSWQDRDTFVPNEHHFGVFLKLSPCRLRFPRIFAFKIYLCRVARAVVFAEDDHRCSIQLIFTSFTKGL